jgi:hypothetical protein
VATHDYVIANGTGAAVRSDLNNALAAIVSQNSSATEPSPTYAYMPWIDTTAGVYKIRNGANNAWITLYQLDGEWSTIALENGTAAAPALYFKDSGTDTGIYSSGTDAVDIATAGVRRVGVSSTGDVTIYAQGDLRLADADSSNWVAFQAPATVASNITWTLPATDGTAGQSLQTNGSGTLSWGTAGGSATRTTFTSSGTWTKPGSGTFARVLIWGGGGGGVGGGGGGGGGACVVGIFALSSLPSTVSVTIGAGGAGSGSSPGSPGGTSSFGSLLTAYGGSGGLFPAAAVGGGGSLGAGTTSAGGAGHGDAFKGGFSAAATYGGGYGQGGDSYWGGAGGAGVSGTGGISIMGGNGATNLTAASVPGGGGGNGTVGAAGICYIDVW